MIVYGRGCCGCQTMRSAPQPLAKAKAVPSSAKHGRAITSLLYGCSCQQCRSWEAREAMRGGGRHGCR